MSLFVVFFLLLTVSAPPSMQVSAECLFRVHYTTTNLRRPQQLHLAQSFLPWAVEDRLHQEDSR